MIRDYNNMRKGILAETRNISLDHRDKYIESFYKAYNSNISYLGSNSLFNSVITSLKLHYKFVTKGKFTFDDEATIKDFKYMYNMFSNNIKEEFIFLSSVPYLQSNKLKGFLINLKFKKVVKLMYHISNGYKSLINKFSMENEIKKNIFDINENIDLEELEKIIYTYIEHIFAVLIKLTEVKYEDLPSINGMDQVVSDYDEFLETELFDYIKYINFNNINSKEYSYILENVARIRIQLDAFNYLRLFGVNESDFKQQST